MFRSVRRMGWRWLALSSLCFFFMLFGSTAWALPEQPSVVHGSIQVQNAGQLQQILQSSPQGIINWNSFSISPNEIVKILQPNSASVLLNRVVGRDPSSILGALQANGRVFLVNPNGILFGPNSRVDAGSFLASTLAISDKDFLNGNYSFTQNPQATLAAIVNQGDIRVADGGFVVLAAPLVHNDGLIVARQGTVHLAATEKATLQLDPQGLWQVVVPDGFHPGFANDQKAGQAVLLQPGQVTDVLSSVVQAGSALEASSLENLGAQALAHNASGLALNSGDIRVDGSAGAAAGRIRIDGERASLNAPGALLSAVGTDAKAGDVRLLSNGATIQAGVIDVQGRGTADAGFSEVSGRSIGLLGPIRLGAEQGHSGSLLLDPVVLTLVPTGGSWDGAFQTGQTVPAGGTIAPDTLSLAAINNVTTGNIQIAASSDIVYNDPTSFNISLPDSVTLTMDAGRNITIGDTFQPTSINIKAGSINMTAGSNIQLSSTGPINLLANTTVGNVDFFAGQDANLVGSSFNITTNQPLNALGVFNLTQVAPGTVVGLPSSINGTAGVDLNLGIIGSSNPLRNVTSNGTINVRINQGVLNNVNLVGSSVDLRPATTGGPGGQLLNSNITAPSVFLGAPSAQLSLNRVTVNSAGRVQLQAGNISNLTQAANLTLDRTTINASDVQLTVTPGGIANITRSNVTGLATAVRNDLVVEGRLDLNISNLNAPILAVTTLTGGRTAINSSNVTASNSVLVSSDGGNTTITGTASLNANVSAFPNGTAILRADNNGLLTANQMQGAARNYQVINQSGGTLTVGNSQIEAANLTVSNPNVVPGGKLLHRLNPGASNMVVNSSSLHATNNFQISANEGSVLIDGTGATVLASDNSFVANASGTGCLNIIGSTVNGTNVLTINASNTSTFNMTGTSLFGAAVNLSSPQSLDIASINSQNATVTSQGNITLASTGNLSGGNFSFNATNATLERQNAGANITPLAGNLTIVSGNIYGTNSGSAFSLVNASSVNVVVTGNNDASRQLAGDLLLVNGANATVSKSIATAVVKVNGQPINGGTPQPSPSPSSVVDQPVIVEPLTARQQLDDQEQVTILASLAQSNLVIGNRSATSYQREQNDMSIMKYSDPWMAGPFFEGPFAVTLSRVIMLDPNYFDEKKLKIEGLDRAMSVMNAQEEQETWMLQYWRRFLERIILWTGDEE